MRIRKRPLGFAGSMRTPRHSIVQVESLKISKRLSINKTTARMNLSRYARDVSSLTGTPCRQASASSNLTNTTRVTTDKCTTNNQYYRGTTTNSSVATNAWEKLEKCSSEHNKMLYVRVQQFTRRRSSPRDYDLQQHQWFVSRCRQLQPSSSR